METNLMANTDSLNNWVGLILVMNRFKLGVCQARNQEDYTRRRQEVNLLTVLDKCTQILRDDRIWVRNKVKEGDQDIIQIFKKFTAKRPLDISALQVSLRKHVTKIKDRSKKEQLQKFKENLNSTTSNSLFERQAGYCERSSKSIPRRVDQAKVHFQEDYTDTQEEFRNYGKPKQQYKVFEEYYNSGRKNPLSGIKMTDPIDEEQEIEQGFTSYRSRSELNRQTKTSRDSSSNNPDDRFSLPWNKLTTTFPLRQSQNDRQAKDELHQQIQKVNARDSESITDPPMFRRNFGHSEEAQRTDETYSNILNSQPESHTGSNFRTSVTYCHNEVTYSKNEIVGSVSNQFRLELNGSIPEQYPSFSVTPQAGNINTKERGLEFADSNTYVPFQSSVYPNHNLSIRKSEGVQDQSLFTSPELLMECRRFLQQSGHKYTESDCQEKPGRQDTTYVYQKVETSVSNLNSFSNYQGLANKAKDCVSETKVLHHANAYRQSNQSCSSTIPQQRIVQSFNNDADQVSNRDQPLVQDISKLYAEDVFDIIFPDSQSSIDLDDYRNVVSANFVQKDKLMKLFKLGDKALNNVLLAPDFGRLLLTVCNYKPSPNLVKEIFSLIDIERRGYFTLDDYQRFLEQVIDTQDPQSPQIINSCSDLFQLADTTRSERVEYWGLYLARGSAEFVAFSTFLEQFEFEVV